jgi:putative peptidoglycan lipid II flippase
VLALRAGTGDGPAAAVIGLGLGNTAGMSVAGLLLLLAMRRLTGAAGLDGVPRALLAGALAALAGGVLGRLVADAVAGPGALTAVLTGVVAALDPRDARELRRTRPVPS